MCVFNIAKVVLVTDSYGHSYKTSVHAMSQATAANVGMN